MPLHEATYVYSFVLHQLSWICLPVWPRTRLDSSSLAARGLQVGGTLAVRLETEAPPGLELLVALAVLVALAQYSCGTCAARFCGSAEGHGWSRGRW